MSSEVDTDDEITVNVDGVHVSKAFEAEEFPVPAIRFRIRSDRDDAVTIRLSEPIPDDFPMDGVGFHPDYESEKWTAFQDHHVEFQRTLQPGEEVTTVYGIRIDGPDEVPQFLTEPDLPTVRPEGESVGERDEEELEDTTIDDIASSDSNQVVKDMLSGKSEGVPGLSDDDGSDTPDASIDLGGPEDEADDDGPEIELDLGGSDTTAETDEESPEIELDLDDDADDAGVDDDEPVVAEAATTESEPTADADDDAALGDDDTALGVDDGSADANADDDTVDAADDDLADATEAAADAEPEADDDPASGVATPGNVAAALATELREGRVDEADEAVLREALEIEDDDEGDDDEPAVPTTVETRIETLQSSVADLEAYTDSLEQFLNDEGTGTQLIAEFKDDVAAMREEVEDLRAEVADTDETVTAVEEHVEDVDGRVDDVADDLAGVTERVEETETAVDAVEDDLHEVETDLEDATARLDEDVEAVRGHVSSVGERVDDAESQIDDVRSSVEDVEHEVDEVAGDVDETRSNLQAEIDAVEDGLQTDIDDVRADLEADVASVRDDIAAIEEWREQLGEMFAGPAVGASSDDESEDDDAADAESDESTGDDSDGDDA